MIPINQIERQYGSSMAFVIATCRLYFNSCSVHELQGFIEERDIDWDTVYEIVVAHQIKPVVYTTLSKNKIELGASLMGKLKQDMLLIVSRNQQKVKQTVDLCNAFKDDDIVVYPYKGVFLSKLLYGDYVGREVNDIDLLIHKRDFLKAKEVLDERGFLSRYDCHREDFYEHMLKVDCEYKCAEQKEGYRNKVELHWSPTHSMFDVPVTNSGLFKRGKLAAVLGKEVDVLDDHDHVLLTLIHHGVNDVWRSLRHIIDWGRVLQNDNMAIEWSILNEKIRNARLQTTAGVGASICYELFGVNNNELIAKKGNINHTLTNLLSFPMLNKNKVSISNFNQQLQLRDSIVDRFRLILKYLIVFVQPSIRDIQTFNLPKKAYFLYYLLKPFRFVYSAMRPKKNYK